MKPFGNLVSEARKKAGLTQLELAIKVGVSRVSIASYEAGMNVPSLETAIKIRDEIGIDLNMMFLESEDQMIKRRKSKKIEKLKVKAAFVLKQIKDLETQGGDE